MKLKPRDLANNLDNTSAQVILHGENCLKQEIIDTLPLNLRKYHQQCQFHIHDLEFYNLSYNCLGVLASDWSLGATSFHQAILLLVQGIAELTNYQSGGIGLINFDEDMAQYISNENDEYIQSDLSDLLYLLNLPLRKGCEKAYVTINFGLSTSPNGRRITRCLLQAYQKKSYIFPNMVFIVSKNINLSPNSPNYDLFQLACAVTASYMNPTYLNIDTDYNKNLPIHAFGIMGCRTRIGYNINGDHGSLHRGNIAAISLNLVQLALQSNGHLKDFYTLLDNLMDNAKLVLLHRFNSLIKYGNFPYQRQYNLYNNVKQSTLDMLRNGTLSIGFIGLWDALTILHNSNNINFDDIKKWYKEALQIVNHMRIKIDTYTKKEQLNFSLLASSGEGISGRFPEYDKKYWEHPIIKKGYYTNSFHIPVHIPLNCFQKINLEAPFHSLCNGGSITYVELHEASSGNNQAIQEIINYAHQQGIGYFGINFPLDICRDCGSQGTFDLHCPICKSSHILRLRRVSGYLSEINSFTSGKYAELQNRIVHSLKTIQ